jgi:hypothetical protein
LGTGADAAGARRGLPSLANREEAMEAGEAYYVPPGHTPVLHAGTEVVEFSPTDALEETFTVVTDNLRAAGLKV